MARELSAIGNVRTMVHALSHLQGKQELARSGAFEHTGDSSSDSDEIGTQGREVRKQRQLQCASQLCDANQEVYDNVKGSVCTSPRLISLPACVSVSVASDVLHLQPYAATQTCSSDQHACRGCARCTTRWTETRTDTST